MKRRVQSLHVEQLLLTLDRIRKLRSSYNIKPVSINAIS